MYHVHIGRLYFALLRDRRNGDFSRCRIENMFVTKKKKEKNDLPQTNEECGYITNKICIFSKKIFERNLESY